MMNATNERTQDLHSAIVRVVTEGHDAAQQLDGWKPAQVARIVRERTGVCRSLVYSAIKTLRYAGELAIVDGTKSSLRPADAKGRR